MEEELRARLISIEERLNAIEAAVGERSAPAREVHQALHDILRIYGLAGQTAEVVTSQRDQIQALAQAYERLSLALTHHDETSGTERGEIRELMEEMRLLLGSLASVVRSQIRHLHDIGRAVGADQTEAERKRLKDVPARDDEKERPA